MASRQMNATIPIEFYDRISRYAKEQDLNFSQALSGVADAGLKFFQIFGSLNIELIAEKVKNTESEVKFLRQAIKRLPGN